MSLVLGAIAQFTHLVIAFKNSIVVEICIFFTNSGFQIYRANVNPKFMKLISFRFSEYIDRKSEVLDKMICIRSCQL